MIDDLLRSGRSFSYQGDYYTRLTNQNFLSTAAEADQITDPDFTPAYWLGFVSWDDLPTSAHVSKHSIDDDGNVIFDDVTRRENVDMTYAANFSDSQSPASAYFCNCYTRYDDDLGRWSAWDISTSYYTGLQRNARLYNVCDVNIYGQQYVNMQFVGHMDDETYHVYFSCRVPILDIFSDSFSATATISGYSDITITQDDLTGEVITRTHDGHTLHFCMYTFFITQQMTPAINPGGAGAQYIWPKPIFRVHDDDDKAYVIGLIGTGASDGGLRISTSGALLVGMYDTTTRIIAGGFAGKITPEDLAATINHFVLIDIADANFVVLGVGRSDFCRVIRKYDLAEIRHILGYQIRVVSTSGTNSYNNGADKWYPLVVNGQFMGVLINGESDRDRLQEWQLVGKRADPTTNAYKESDKPIYIPPDPDESDKIGDSIGFRFSFPSAAATGLYTMYALRAAHMGQLGARLWASIGDGASNFWQNIQMAVGAFSETGSADISQILDYFTSLRVYPFALANLPGFAGAGSGSIRIGAGKTALDLSGGGAGNVGIMGQYTGIIDAGSVVVPYHYEDFRDIDDVTVSVYLPYIGTQTLNAADVLGCTLSLSYAVDLTSGSCVAYLLLSGRWGYYPIGIYSGTIGADIPLTATQGNRLFTRQLSNAISDISSLVSGKLIPETVGGGISAISKMQSAANALTAGGLTPAALGGGGANFAGFGAPQTAYLQIRRHKYAYSGRSFPASQIGRRTSGVQYLGALSGFTVCENVDVSGIPAPADVQRDIKSMLESGVYL